MNKKVIEKKHVLKHKTNIIINYDCLTDLKLRESIGFTSMY
jgi:hypothetical protein